MEIGAQIHLDFSCVIYGDTPDHSSKSQLYEIILIPIYGLDFINSDNFVFTMTVFSKKYLIPHLYAIEKDDCHEF